MPLEINRRLRQVIANLGFACACLVVGLHVKLSVPIESVGLELWMWRVIRAFRGEGLGNMAVPVFFAISGFLIAGRLPYVKMSSNFSWWHVEIKKRLKSLLVPYLVWNLAFLAFRMVLSRVAEFAGQSFYGGCWRDLSIPRICEAIGLDPFAAPELTPLWFVRCLIVFVVALPVFLPLRHRAGILLVGVSFALYYFLPNLLPPAADWQTHFYKLGWARGVAYYSLGIWLRFNFTNIVNVMKRLDTVKCFHLMSKVSTCDVPEWLVASAFPIYLLHDFVLTLFIAGFRVVGIKKLMETSWWSWWAQLLAAIAICAAVTLMIKRIVPRFAALIFGGR